MFNKAVSQCIFAETFVLQCSAIIHSDKSIKKPALLVWQPPTEHERIRCFLSMINTFFLKTGNINFTILGLPF